MKTPIITAIIVAVLIGGVVYFYRSNSQFSGGDIPAPIPMRILINTSGDSPIIDDEIFTPGEWRHVSEEWFQKNAEELKNHPEIKEARTILEEKLAGVPEGELKRTIKENNLQSFAQGLKDASTQYNQPLPAIADEILKIVPYEK